MKWQVHHKKFEVFGSVYEEYYFKFTDVSEKSIASILTVEEQATWKRRTG
jgi:hypothetical protein